MSDPIILEQLTKKYGEYEVVKDLSLSVARGKTLGLVGANGAGKTTTIAMIMGLITPTSGQVKLFGTHLSSRNTAILKRMNFQSPYLGMPAQLSVKENLIIFGKLYSVANLKSRIEELVADFSLGDVLYRQVNKLSAGQKTRVSLAKALINNPEILLLDEPTASLDPERAEWLRHHLLKYQKNNNTTILLSSHNMHEVERLCHTVAIMSYGRVIDAGSAQDMLKNIFQENSYYEEDFSSEASFNSPPL